MKLAQVCSEMIPNKLKQLWSQGKPTINGWCSIANPFTAKIVAAQGYDSITMRSIKSALPMLQVSGVIPMARVPWMEPGIIMKILDAGAYGVICPMVNNARQAAEFVSYMRYPPLGQRSFGPTRVSFAAGADYGAKANKEMLAFAMIETAEGMANLSSPQRPVSTESMSGPLTSPLGWRKAASPPASTARSPT